MFFFEKGLAKVLSNLYKTVSEPKNHHYIPQSYLRNFSKESKGEYYVYVRFHGEKFYRTNIRNICSENYFYSIPDAAEDKKNIVEKYYADHIDSLFPEITEVITNDNISRIDLITRRKIITAALSLYFRTPKFLNAHNKHLSKVIELLKNYSLGKTEIHTIEFLGRKIDVKNVDFEKLEEDTFKQNKIVFLKQHFEIFNAFVDFKLNDGIGVKKIVDDSEFITSDNPLIIRNQSGELSNLFHPENSILLPINNKYLLMISPKSDTFLSNTFHRIEGRFKSVFVINVDVEEKSEKWIIGSEKSVLNHITDQIKYNEPTEANEKLVTDSDEKVKLLGELDEVLEKNNNKITDEFIVKIKALNNHELFKDDGNIIKTMKNLREQGYDI
ncbi:MAG: DUF4238 domain-containing protein [Bacteroidia bacterium]